MNGHASLNRFYRLVWSQVTQTWHAVSEITKSHGKGGRARGQAVMGVLASVALGGMGTLAHAQQAPPAVTQLPTGGVVAQGVASISQTASAQAAAMAIHQSSQRAVLNWNSFNVGQNASVTFNQPNAQAVTLNRIADQNPSQIYGQINANGQVYLTNPNGIYFSPTAQVNVGALVATTHGISDADFMAGNMVFSRNGATGSVVNEGQINAALGGYIALLAPEVRNSGVVVAQAGTVALAAGEVITLNFGGSSGLAGLTVTPATLATLVENRQAVRAPGGLVILSAQSVASLQSGVINNTGTVEATTLSAVDGVIRLEASQAVVQTGTLRAPSIAVQTQNLIDAGTWDASAAGNGASHGGSIQVAASGSVEQTQSAQWSADGYAGGSIRVAAQSSVYLSGALSANGTNNTSGGDIAITAPSVGIAGATVSADGDSGGGRIRIGGGWQGNDSTLANADTTTVSASSLHANALNNGNGGTVVVWSNSETQYAGAIQAQGGTQGGNGGQVEVSSHETLQQQGTVDVTAAHGSAGSALFDPKNIQIVAVAPSGPSVLSLTDSVAANRYLGATSVTELVNGTPVKNAITGFYDYTGVTSLNRILVASATDSTVATSAGSIRIFNSQTGALVSSLTGSTANDQVGSGTVTNLGNGNYVVTSPLWSGGTSATAKGAATWINGTTGVTGVVSSSNSLVGSAAGDGVGSGGVTALTNGNYAVRSTLWGSGNGTTASALGAVTWGNGTTGTTTGVVSSSNSLVGSAAGDQVGSTSLTALTNGNYVVSSSSWGGGLGAVTWANGATGITGVVSSSNSLVGSAAGDAVGAILTALTNGNYVVSSSNWSINVGAVTWANGATGITGVVSSSNSLVGSAAGDQVGGGPVAALTNGNYVVASPYWGSGNGTLASALGAVTWGNGTIGTTGVVSSSNSLVGSAAGDDVGNASVTVLTNGNYVVRSPIWGSGNGTTASALGAVTWGNGTTGTTGVVSSSNSLVGSAAGDDVGRSVTALTNGNYVVASAYWGSGNGTAATAKGAVTWGNGTTGTAGVVSSGNSLVGSNAGDEVGVTGVTALITGDYLVRSAYWGSGNGTAASAKGAVTWGSGTSGVTGAVSSSNSLVGSTAGDDVGSGGVAALLDGRAVVASPNWTQPASGSTAAVSHAGRVDILSATVSGASSTTSTVSFSTNSGGTSYLLTSGIASLLNAGTSVTLQANNDITVASAITSTGSGVLTLDAGRSVLLNASISLNNANLSVIGNEWVTAAGGVGGGVIDAQRDAGAAVITQASSTSLSTGTGDISLILRGADASGNKTNQTTGAITLVAASGHNVTVQDNGTTAGSNVAVGTVTAAGNLTVVSNGTLDLGTSTVGGNLSATSNNGNITQTGALSVTGTSSLNAGTGTVVLASASNDFGGAVSGTAASATMTDTNALSLGNWTTTGNLTVTSTGLLNLGNATVGGNLSATSNNYNISGIANVTGTSTLNAGTGTSSVTSGPSFSMSAQTTSAQVQAVTSAQIAGLSTADVQNLTASQIGYFTTTQIGYFSASQLGLLSNSQVGALTTAQVAALSNSQLAGLSVAQLGALSASQANALTQAQRAALSTAQLAAIQSVLGSSNSNGSNSSNSSSSSSSSSSSTSSQTNATTSPSMIAGSLTSSLTSSLNTVTPSSSSRQSVSPTTVTPPSMASTVTPGQMVSISPTQISGLSAAQVQSISPTALSVLSPQQVAAFTPEQVSSLSATQVQAMTPTQVSSLSPSQVESLTPSQIGAMSPTQLSSLSNTQVASLSAAQAQSLSASQLAALPTAQAAQIVALASGNAQAAANGTATSGASASGVATSSASASGAASSLTSAQVSSLSPTQLSSLLTSDTMTPAQVQSLSAATVGSLSLTTLVNLPASAVQSLTVTQLQALSPSQARVFNATQGTLLNAEQQAALGVPVTSTSTAASASGASSAGGASSTSDVATLITPQGSTTQTISTASTAGTSTGGTVSAMQANAAGTSSPTASAGVSGSTGAGSGAAANANTANSNVTNSNVVGNNASGNTVAVSTLSASQVAALKPQQLRSLSDTQVSTLSIGQVQALTGKQLATFSPTQVQALGSEQVKALQPEQLSSLPIKQVAAFSPAQLSTMSRAQAVALMRSSANLLNSSQSALSPAQRQAVNDVLSASVSSSAATTAASSNGVLPVAVVGAAANSGLGVRFDGKGGNEVKLQMADAPVNASVSSSRVNARYTTIEVRNANNEPVTFRGAIVGDRLVIAAPSPSARQMARTDLPNVLSSAIDTLAAGGKAIVLDSLKGVVLNLR